MKLQIYDFDAATVAKLKERAAKLGYSGHIEMLRDYIQRLADEDVVLASDQRYIDVINRLTATLEFVDQTLTVSIAEGKLASPFTSAAKEILFGQKKDSDEQ